jgi:hypothetical protein
MGPIQMGTHVASTSYHVLLDVVVPHGSHVRDGWDLFQRKPTVASVSPRFAIRGRSTFCICEVKIRFIPKGAYPRLDAVHAAA